MIFPLLRQVVARITTRADLSEMLDRRSHIQGCLLRGRELGVTTSCSNENQPTPPLWNAIVLGVQHRLLSLVTKPPEFALESNESPIGGQTGDILKHHGFRPQRAHKAEEFEEEIVLRTHHAAFPIQGAY